MIVVDDSVEVLKAIRSFLSTHREIEIVGEFRHGFDLAEKAVDLRPDLVITNIHGPRIGGIEYTLPLRESLPQTHFVVFVDLAGSFELGPAARDAVVYIDRQQLAERLDREIRRLFPDKLEFD